jgi:hypothetical protein
MMQIVGICQESDKNFMVDGGFNFVYFNSSKNEVVGRGNNLNDIGGICYYIPLNKFSHTNSTPYFGVRMETFQSLRYADSLETKYIDFQISPFFRYRFHNFYAEIGGGLIFKEFMGKNKFESVLALFPNYKNRSEFWYIEVGYSFRLVPDIYFEPSIQYSKEYAERKFQGNPNPINYTEKGLSFDFGMKYLIDNRPLSKFLNRLNFLDNYKQSTVVTSISGILKYYQKDLFEITDNFYLDLNFNLGYFVLDRNLIGLRLLINNEKFGENEPDSKITPSIYYRNYFCRNLFGEGTVEISFVDDWADYKILEAGLGIGYSLPISKYIVLDFKSMFSRAELFVKQYQPEIGNQINYAVRFSIDFLIFINK